MIKRILTFNKKEDLENLKRPSVEVTAFDSILTGWANELRATTLASNCYGIAAPQIGINIRMICIDCNKVLPQRIMINPKIIEATGKMKHEEMCLSFPGLAVKMKRKSFVKVKYQDVCGNEEEYVAVGMEAVCIQHEVDHLNGILLSDNGQLYKVK